MKNNKEKTTFIDRVISTLLFSFCIILTTAIAPIVASIKVGAPGGVKFYYFYTHWLFVTLIIGSMFLGFVLGPINCFKVLGHLWYTEKPHNNNLTAFLWVILIAAGVISYVYSTKL